MKLETLQIKSAYWLSPGSACIILSDDWNFDALPPLKLSDPSICIKRLRRMPPSDLAYFTSYQIKDNHVEFILDPARHPHIDFHSDPVLVAGDFNNWGRCTNQEDFILESKAIHSQQNLFSKIIDQSSIGLKPNKLEHLEFKFITKSGYWIKPLSCAPNIVKDSKGNLNYYLNIGLKGNHAFLFNLDNDRGINRALSVSLDKTEFKQIIPGLSFFDLRSNLKLGATIESNGSTTFRIFAPRANSVSVGIKNDSEQDLTMYPLKLCYDQLTWELNIETNLIGFYYYFFVDGYNDSKSTQFDKNFPILDPYAKATKGPDGPGIIINESTINKNQPFCPPRWEDLSILECHVRDVTENLKKISGSKTSSESEVGCFRAISKYLFSENNYLLTLGVNTIELLPIQQFDSKYKNEYHWGYMTNNYFSPCYWYASKEDDINPNQSFKKMIEDFHNFGKSVIIDVVYNHVGLPPHLAYIDLAYYFYLNSNGKFENWSGCGNTLRSESAMSKNLIIDSLCYMVEKYDIDGFRFDLAELIGVEVLYEIRIALKRIKPSIILIAEPWSFRGQIKRDLRFAGFMFWNDEFREFVDQYVKGNSNISALDYFINGSTSYLSAWPSQSINYMASHDDYAWIDKITENENFNGNNPTKVDVLRTHMAIALTFISIGVPMITQGTDFLKSKSGFKNTYNRGDLNLLDYNKIQINSNTHFYTKKWIEFRQSEWGECLRLQHIQNDKYIKTFRSESINHSSAIVLFNSNLSKTNKQILFMINPHEAKSTIPLGNKTKSDWKLIASINEFNLEGIKIDLNFFDVEKITLPPMSLFLAIRNNWNC